MLARQHRLTRSTDFRRAVRRGTRVRRGGVVLHVSSRPDGPQSPARLGLIVGRAVGNSVARHRTARIVRHRVGARLDELVGRDVVVRILPGGMSRAGLRRDLDTCLNRAAGSGPETTGHAGRRRSGGGRER